MLLNILAVLFLQSFAQVPAPTDTAHPGNSTSVLNFERVEIQSVRQGSALYLPQRTDGQKAPLVVFGHGQALNETHYDETLQHLAQKGVAALYVKYDNGFFDQSWRRMADDWNNITQAVLNDYADRIDASQVIYSGHSKGGYVGLVATGAPSRPALVAGIFFAPAGYDQEYLQQVDDSTAITLVWGVADSIIDRSAVMEIYNKLATPHKQFIEVQNYGDRQADHYFPQNKSTFFGGQNGVSAFHHHGVWQWLVAAAWDAEAGAPLTQTYLYGDKAGDSGDPAIVHKVLRSWEVRRSYVFKMKPQSAVSSLGAIIGESRPVVGSWHQAVLTETQRRAIERSDAVEFVGRNIEFKMLAEPDDLHPDQWAFRNPLGFDVSAVQAWSLSTGNENIVVGVVDSGIHLRHSDLRDNIWQNPVEAAGEKGTDDDNNGYVDDVQGFHFLLNKPDANDTRGHGTMVSGMIGARGNNGYGLAGMAWNVKLMPLNMFPNMWGNATLEAAVKAIHYAVDNGVDVINASFGQADDDLVPDEGFNIFIEALEKAEQAGIPVVAAAGNSSGNNDAQGMIPATLPLDNIIAVGAMNKQGRPWSKTNYGKRSVEVMAPGEQILTTSTGGTKSTSGTSLSAPIVTGLVVLMLDRNPNLTPSQIREILVESCNPHPPLAELSQCGGYLNAFTAVERASLY